MQDEPKKKQATPEAKRATRALAHALFRQEWKKTNPKATAAERKAAFAAVKKDYLKAARGLRNRLAKSGVALTVTGPAPKAAAKAEATIDA